MVSDVSMVAGLVDWMGVNCLKIIDVKTSVYVNNKNFKSQKTEVMWISPSHRK